MQATNQCNYKLLNCSTTSTNQWHIPSGQKFSLHMLMIDDYKMAYANLSHSSISSMFSLSWLRCGCQNYDFFICVHVPSKTGTDIMLTECMALYGIMIGACLWVPGRLLAELLSCPAVLMDVHGAFRNSALVFVFMSKSFNASDDEKI